MGNPIQYRDSHYKGKTVIRPSYLYDGDPLLVRWHLYIETAFLFIKEYFLWDFRHQVEKHHKHIWRIWKLTYMKHPKFNTSTLLFFKDALYFQSILFSYIHLFLFSNKVNSSRPGDPYGITKFGQYWFNTLRLRQNGRRFADTFKCIFLKQNVRISIQISLKFVPKGPINNNPALVQIMAWRRSGDKPLSKPIMARLPMHICVTRPQWVK